MAFITDCLFIGYEIEGMPKGVKTLFVGSHDIEPHLIEEALVDDSIRVVYFGAGNNRGLPAHYIYLVTKYSSTHTIRLEINSLEDLAIIPTYHLDFIQVILVIPTNLSNKVSYISAIKLLGKDHLQIAYTDKWYRTDFNDPEFDKDIKL